MTTALVILLAIAWTIFIWREMDEAPTLDDDGNEVADHDEE